MSINSTGIYGTSTTIVTSDLCEDVEQLKTNVTTLTSSHLNTASEHDGLYEYTGVCVYTRCVCTDVYTHTYTAGAEQELFLFKRAYLIQECTQALERVVLQVVRAILCSSTVLKVMHTL
jgi:hypothetical protein